MKLIYISHWRFPSEKTMSPLIMKTCEMFAGRGIDVELWVPWRNNPKFRNIDPFSYHGIKRDFIIRRIFTIDFTGIVPGNFIFFAMLLTFNFSLFIYAFFKGFRQETIFYFHDERDAITLAVFKKNLFLEIHDFYKSGFEPINRFCFSKITGFIVTNLIKMAALEKEYGISRDRMIHRPNGVDIKMFDIFLTKEEARERLNLPSNKKIILYAGHLFYWKGADTLFDAHKFLRENEIIYFVGGTDDDIKKFKSKCQDLNVKNVIIAGMRPHKEIPVWLKAADLLVLPNTAKFPESKYETSPVKLFEYMASGCPIVASDLPSIRNIVDEEMVFFAKPDDPQSFAETILFVFENQDEAKSRSTRSFEEVQKYSWEKREEAIEDFIKIFCV